MTDLTTGEERWNLEPNEALPGADGAVLWDGPMAVSEDGETILVEYVRTECGTSWCAPADGGVSDELGLAAMSTSDGSVLWTTPMRPSVPLDDPSLDYDGAALPGPRQGAGRRGRRVCERIRHHRGPGGPLDHRV